ncbi:MAG: aspartyl/glutamyl-tRNA amidotransferase subunit A [Candidatus Woesearchaeota archaeon]|nr:aspartyl/glutamyl-tRNA amidotransferase subunit A [Candidatus Woesearchaeota archaeon]
MKASEFVEKTKAKKIDVIKYTEDAIKEAKRINEEYNYFNVICDDIALSQAKDVSKNPKGKLAGLLISVKDCICVKGVETTSGSRILKGYRPLFNATAVEKCINEGAIIIGKTSQDEFGFGGFSTNIGLDYKTPMNPFDKERATGGSSGGAAGITQKASFAHVALAESTGGSIVNPASFCGVYGICPTYGRVSRYGLIDYGNSLDKIGLMSKYLEDIAIVLQIIAGFDEKESTSLDAPVDNYAAYIGKDIKGIRIGLIKEAFGKGVDERVSKKVKEAVKKLESKGAIIKEISLPLTIKYGIAVYYIIATSEASTNLQKYCGMRYGKHEKLEGSFNEYFAKVRSMHFGKEAKRRIMLGTFARMAGYRDAYYLKAMKVRQKIIEEYKKAFNEVDVLISPTVPILPPRFDEINKLSLLQNYMIDILTVGPNLAGLPHLNVPVGFEKEKGKNLPVGMMIIGDHLKEGMLMQVAKKLE